MKGLVLAGGSGTRMRPITSTQAKQLIPIANKPVLFYALEQLVHCGITEIGIVVGSTSEEIKKACGDGSSFGAKFTYIQQDKPAGLAHAVKISKPFLQDDEFCVFLGDNFLMDVSYLERCVDSETPVTLMTTKVENPSSFGIVEMENGKVFSLQEKPKKPKSNLALVGIYVFKTPLIWQAVDAITPSNRGELEITDALSWLLYSGVNIGTEEIVGYWKDLGTPESILQANQDVLDEFIDSKNTKNRKTSVKIQGRVSIGENVALEDVTIRGPAIIGDGCVIKNSYIGPYTSIDSNCVIIDTEIHNSIILSSCRIETNKHRLENSIIGSECEILANKNNYHSVLLGQGSKLEL